MFFYKMVLIMISSMCSFLSQADKSSVEAGAEIYINYGNKGNEVLLTLICVDLELITTNDFVVRSYSFSIVILANLPLYDLDGLIVSHIPIQAIYSFLI
jgi:hypothetical protein